MLYISVEAHQNINIKPSSPVWYKKKRRKMEREDAQCGAFK